MLYRMHSGVAPLAINMRLSVCKLSALAVPLAKLMVLVLDSSGLVQARSK